MLEETNARPLAKRTRGNAGKILFQREGEGNSNLHNKYASTVAKRTKANAGVRLESLTANQTIPIPTRENG